MPLRLIFMGTPDFSVPTLLALVAHGHEIVAVYTRAPKCRAAGAGCNCSQPRLKRLRESSACPC